LKYRIYNLIKIFFAGFTLGAIALAADSVKTPERSFEKLAEGVYVIRHKDAPDTFPQGNTTVILGEREVLVVDSCYLPSSAREDIAQIKQWTNKPVRYLVNTHWHFDHTMGNGAYWEAFSPLAIIAHIETAKQITGYNPGWFERFPRRADRLKQILESGKDPNDKPLTEGEKKEYREAIAGIEPVQAEFKTLVDRAPNLTFETELSIDLGNRVVEIKHLGRGNTAGDTVIYLPKEKILVTGDLIVHPVPYLFSGYPAEFVKTLSRLNQVDFQIIVPGHGRVLRAQEAKNYVDQVNGFIQTVVLKVDAEVYRLGGGSRNLDAVREGVRKNVDVGAWRQKFAGNDKDNQDFFDGAFAGLVTSAYAEIWGR
jgi:cyclase